MKYLYRSLLVLIFALSAVLPSGQVSAQAVCPSITQTLSYGQRNNEVLSLQTFLAGQGLLGEESTSGYFGPLTQTAVSSFQSSNGLASDGVVGPTTRVKINSLCGGSSASLSSGSSAMMSTNNVSGGGGNASVNLVATSIGGGAYSLSWTSRGVTSCTSNDFYINPENVSTSGQASVNVSTAMTFSIACVHASGIAQAQATVYGGVTSGGNTGGNNGGNGPVNGGGGPTGPAPVISSITPSPAPVLGTAAVSGSNFDQNSKVYINSAVTPTSVTPTSLDFIVPAGTPSGPNIVLVSNGTSPNVQYSNSYSLNVTGGGGGGAGVSTGTLSNFYFGMWPQIMGVDPGSTGQITFDGNVGDANVFSNYYVPTGKTYGTKLQFFNQSIQWTSSDPTIATVTDNAGGGNVYATVTGIRPGNTVITAKIIKKPIENGFVWDTIYDNATFNFCTMVSCNPIRKSTLPDGTKSVEVSANVTVFSPSGLTPPTANNKFQFGDGVSVVGSNVNARVTASLSSAINGVHNAGDKGTITGGPTVSGGHTWWNVGFGSLGGDGWISETYLTLVSGNGPFRYPVSALKLYGQSVSGDINLSGDFKREPNSSLSLPNIDFPEVVAPQGSSASTIPIEMTIPVVASAGSFTSCTISSFVPSSGSNVTLSNPQTVSGGQLFSGSLPIPSGKTPRDVFRWRVNCAYSGSGGGTLDFTNISIVLVRPVTINPYCMVGNSFGPTSDQTYPFSVVKNPLRTIGYGNISIPSAASGYDFEVKTLLPARDQFSSTGLPGTILSFGQTSCGPGCLQYPPSIWRPDILPGGQNANGFDQSAPRNLYDDAYKKYVIDGSNLRIKMPNGRIIQGSSGSDGSGDDDWNTFNELWPKSPWGAVSGINIPEVFTQAPGQPANNLVDSTGTLFIDAKSGVGYEDNFMPPYINLPMTQTQLNAAYSYLQGFEADRASTGTVLSNTSMGYDKRLSTVLSLMGSGSGAPSLQAVNQALAQSGRFNDRNGNIYPDYVIGSCLD